MRFSMHDLGWQAFFDQQVTIDESTHLIVARVFAHHGSQVFFNTEFGEFSVPISIVGNGAGHDESAEDGGTAGSIAIGDWFLLEPGTHRGVRQLERKTTLYRKAAGDTIKPQLIASNVDTVFVVSSCNQDFNLSRLERYLALILESGAVPLVVLTKSDLCDDPASLRQQAEQLHAGLIVEALDARDPDQTKVLESWCRTGQTIAMLGSSGVGKSTLANTMCGLDIRTAAIREDDGKGRHTTTARSMHRLKAGGWLIDNPGMRELQLPACEDGLADLFDDVLRIAQNCKFRNCSHQGDAGCALEAAVETGALERRRVVNYLKLQSEQRRNSESLAERRERERRLGRFYKQVVTDKESRKRS